jgi:hypothetical protein
MPNSERDGAVASSPGRRRVHDRQSVAASAAAELDHSARSLAEIEDDRSMFTVQRRRLSESLPARELDC